MSVITLTGVSKSYRQYPRPWDRLLEVLTRSARHHAFTALEPMDLSLSKGEVLGVIGRNGAGKSTLLKILSGTLQPTTGQVETHAQIAALLELGAGFHPEMSGRENVYLGGAVAGLSRKEIDRKYPEIVEFSGLEAAMDRPVKTYSSGMNARLAFAVAMAVEPEILILDETLSVGDGAFARKSFDRIIDFRRRGRTLLFCSHSMYQVEAICDRVIWLDQGRVRLDGPPDVVIPAYSAFLDQMTATTDPLSHLQNDAALSQGPVRLMRVEASTESAKGRTLSLRTGENTLNLRILFRGDPNHPVPSLGVTLTGSGGTPLASASSLEDGLLIERQSDETYEVVLSFPRLPLLRGCYGVNVFLLCEAGLHFYESALQVAELQVEQTSRELGVVHLEREWTITRGIKEEPATKPP